MYLIRLRKIYYKFENVLCIEMVAERKPSMCEISICSERLNVDMLTIAMNMEIVDVGQLSILLYELGLP
jgi:hypothetical protein